MSIAYTDLKRWYIENADAIKLAAEVFGEKQPSIYPTDSYWPRNANWCYQIGLVQAGGTHYEVVTQFGRVIAARRAYIPLLEEPTL